MSHRSCEESSRAKGKLIHAGPFQVRGLPESLDLTVYLPPGYEASTERYPLALFFDGQNMFDDDGSYRGGWQLHRLLDYRACQGHRVPIAVAIHTAGFSRASILSPWSRDDVQGLGDRFLDWMTQWLIPNLRDELRIAEGAENVLMGGSSLGGLLSLYGFLRHPNDIGRVVAMSPSLGLPGGRHSPLFDFAYQTNRAGGRVYIDAGARECECTSILRHTGELADLLEHKGYRRGVDLHWQADPDGAHDEQSWKRRLPGALDFICDERRSA